MKMREEEVDKGKFSDLWKTFVGEFKNHAKRVKAQYWQMRYLKDHLPDDHATTEMDFTENYTCQHAQEIQSPHWNAPSMVTPHPCVVYYNGTNKELECCILTSPVC